MLARATAAAAGIPLLYCTGSDFVEMFVGRGAARVRNIFEQAQKLSPCIIFIDEIDTLGKSRDMNGGGAGNPFSRSNDEAEQTLNQLLSCMDGLDTSRRICVLAATNRREVLDSALVRPGRFDRIVKLELPNAAGRERILRVHCAKLPNFVEGNGVDPKRLNALGQGRKIDLSAVAAVTDGLSGAELEFVVNEAAIRAVRRYDATTRLDKKKNNAAGSSNNKNDGNVVGVEAVDFEDSVKSYFATRRPKGGGIDNMLRGVLQQR
jgi:cell division protease FtsH